MTNEQKDFLLQQLSELVCAASHCNCTDVAPGECPHCPINGGGLVDAVCRKIAELSAVRTADGKIVTIEILGR